MAVTVPKFLTNLLNKVKRYSSAPTLVISEHDIVVFVVGPTGSGKSWFINTATGCELVVVSRQQHPFTGHVQAIRCELTDEAKRELPGVENIVFVDTPSFLTGCDQIDTQKAFKTWFSKTVYKPQHVGAIYMHRVETDPRLEPIKDHLQEFSSIPQIRDTSLPQRLRIVTSYDNTSGTIPQAKILQRTTDIRIQVDSLPLSAACRWQPSIHRELFQGEPGVAWRVVEELFRT